MKSFHDEVVNLTEETTKLAFEMIKVTESLYNMDKSRKEKLDQLCKMPLNRKSCFN